MKVALFTVVSVATASGVVRAESADSETHGEFIVNVPAQSFTIEVVSLSSNGEAFHGVSLGTCLQALHLDLGFPNAICVDARLTPTLRREDLGNRARTLFALPFTTGLSFQAYASRSVLAGVDVGVGAMYAFDTAGMETEHWLSVLGRIGAHVTAFKLTVSADVYLIEGTPLMLGAGVTL